jgi:hypothetical protein
MQAGLAILANDLDYVKHIIDRYQCGAVYTSNEPDTCLKSINQLINDADFRIACQKQAKLMAIQEFNWQCQSRSLYDTCARLLNLKDNDWHAFSNKPRVA